jgi:protein Tex
METPIPVDLGRIAQDMQIRRVQVESVVQMLDEGNTVPFITRYRKERTGNLSELAIREIQIRAQRLRELAERRETILKTIETQGKLTDELAAAIRAADNPKRLEDLYLPYKPKKRSKASEARDKGLEPLALGIWNREESLTDLQGAAAELINAEKGLENADQVLEGVGHILAEAVSELSDVRDIMRRVVWKIGKLVTTKSESLAEGQGLEFRDYFQFSEPVNHVPPHRVLAINRGEKEGALKAKLDVLRQELQTVLLAQLPLDGHPHAEFFSKAAIDGLDRLLFPSLEREVRRDLTEMAERHALDVFARNLRSLLLQPPIAPQTILAIDPGFRSGCKVAVLDPHGNLLEHGVIHPHQPQNKRYEAKNFIKDLVGKHSVSVVAIGNGTASRETEELVTEIIAEGTYFVEHPDATSMPVAVPAPAPAARSGDASQATDQADATTGHDEATASHEEATASHEEATAGHDEATAEATDAAPQPHHLDGEAAQATEPAATPEAHGDGAAPPTPEPPAAEPANGESGAAESEPPAVHAETVAAAEAHAETFPPISGGAPEAGEEEHVGSHATPTETVAPPDPANGAELSAAPVAESSDTSTSEPRGGGADAPVVSAPHAGGDASATEAAATAESSSEPGAPQASADGSAPPATAEDASGAAGTTEPEAAAVVAPAEGVPVAADATSAPESQSGATAAPAGESAPVRVPAGGQRSSKSPSPEFARPPKASKEHPPKPPRPKQPPSPPKPHVADGRLAQLSYVIVNEAGASVYSASPVGREDFPDHDATTRGTISIGRRLQDPLAELVKIEPQNIGVGLYQHDVNPKHLKESLEMVVESCVNFVGVELNTASAPLLRLVSGLNSLTARRVVDHRKEKGPFKNREQLLDVEGVGPATFTQAAGFLKIRDGERPFDRTWVHPESYAAATKLLEKLELSPEAITHKDQLEALRNKLPDVDIPAMAKELEIGEPTLRDIFDALARPDRDAREDLPTPIFKKGVLKLEDLAVGMELKGTVLNVVDFGAFVDVGLKDSGLVHISQLANRFIKSPHDIVSVGDVVTVWISGVDNERKRVSLTMVKPGTPRAHGPQGGGPRDRGRRGGPQGGEGRPQGQGQGQGQRDDRDRRGGAQGQGPGQGQGQGQGRRPPRRDGQAPPQGAPEGQGIGAPGDRPAGAPPAPPAPRVNQRIPGPPQRAQHGGRGGGGYGGQRRGGPGGAGGGGGGGGGSNSGPSARFERAQAPRPPAKPAPPPPPLSKDALTGNVPLRTFGQLKQLFEERGKDDEPTGDGEQANPPSSEAPAAGGESPTPESATPPEASTN